MKKKVLQWAGGVALSAVAILIYLLLFQTNLFSGFTLNSLNNYLLKPYNLTLKGNITGGFLAKSLGIHQLLVLNTQTNDTLILAEDLNLKGTELDWSTKELSVKTIMLKDYFIDTQKLQSIKSPKSKQPTQNSILIEQLSAINGSIHMNYEDSLHLIELHELGGKFWFIDGFTGVNLHLCSVYAPVINSDTVQVTGTFGLDVQGSINLDNLKVRSPGINMEMQAVISPGMFSARLKGEKISLETFNNIQLPANYAGLEIDFDTHVQYTEKQLELTGPGALHFNGAVMPFNLKSFTRDAAGESLALQLGSELMNIEISAYRDSLKYLRGTADIFRIDLNPFLKLGNIHISEPIGNMTFSGTVDNYSIRSRLASFMVNDLRFDSLASDLSITSTGTLSFSNTSVFQADNRISISGTASKEQLDFSGQLLLSDYSFLSEFNYDNPIQGHVAADFTIKGNPSAPHISAEFTPEKFGTAGTFNLTGLGKIDMQFQDKQLNGNLALMGNEGLLLGDSLKSYTVLVNISDNDYQIEDLHFQGQHNLVSLSGRFNSQHLEVNKFKVIMDENRLNLVDSVKITRSPTGLYDIPESVLSFNRGGLAISGSYSTNSGLDVKVDYELIDLARVSRFLRLKTPFEGLGSGTAHISGVLSNPEIHTQLILKNGLTLGYPSDSAFVDLTLKGNTVISNQINAYQAGGSLKLSGQLPWGYKMRGAQYSHAAQNFSIILDNYRLQDLKFSSIIGFSLAGRASGSLSIRGTPLSTKLDGQISVKDAKFDTLRFTKAYTDFTYEDNLLTFDSLAMVSTWGYGTGEGFMPISLDMIAPDRMVAADRKMGLNFEFILNEMPFLTSYISSIDVIHGDFSASLGFTGPLSAPIRHGKIRGHNAYLEVSVLGNPITDIHSEITLTDNTMTIDHFSGRMVFSEGSNLTTEGGLGWATAFLEDLIGVNATRNYAGVVTAQGEIDFKSFFHPRFDVRLTADEVYYRSTDSQIEAIADAEMHFTGQDTLDATAVIPVIRAVYNSNFESEATYVQSVSKVDNYLFKYSLDTQFASDLFISNDQMEAEFEGELWLLDYGDGVMRFTGNLTAREGGKFYYVGNELTIISGEIIFNSVDFNPQINFKTEIEIDNKPVMLTLSGDLNEPELLINAEDTHLTQSDVLTYLTINQKMVEVSFDTQSALNPVKTYSEMLIEKQISKIGREVIGLDILDVGINFDSDTTAISRFELGKRLSKNLIVTGAVQTTGGDSDYDFGLEYRINRNVSVTSKINQDGEVELNGRLKFTY